MNVSDKQAQPKRPDDSTIIEAPVHIDSKGRLSVNIGDLAASTAFRDNLDRAATHLAKELAERHSAKIVSTG